MKDIFTDGLREEIEECLQQDVIVADLEYPFAAAGTLDDYLRIREKFPDVDFPAYSLVWDPVEWIVNMDAVTDIGISARNFVRAFKGEVSSMDAICLQLLRRQKEFDASDDKVHAVRRRLKESDATINFLVAGMHEVCMHHGVRAPGSLMYLTTLRLCGQNSAAKKRSNFRRFAFAVYETFVSPFPGMTAPLDGQKPSFRKIAKILGVPTSSVSRAWSRIVRTIQLSEMSNEEMDAHLDPPIEAPGWDKGFHL